MKTIYIGKNAENDYVINAPTVSRKHAVITVDDNGTVTIKDLNSTNGTYVNGERVTQKTLREGDVVMVAKDQVVDWPRLVKSDKKKGMGWNWKIAAIIAGVIVLAGAGVGGYMLFGKSKSKASDTATIAATEQQNEPAKKLTTAEIYEKYGSAVCLLMEQHSYTISIEWKDDPWLAQYVYRAIGLKENTSYSIDEYGDMCEGGSIYLGTAFFISEDGKMGTNLHNVKHWLFYPEEIDILQQKVEAAIINLANEEGDIQYLALSKHVKITPHLDKIVIHPNGLPFSSSNVTECVVYSAGDDPEKDVAIIQTVTHKLPNGVDAYIDIKDAQTDESAYNQGKYVCLIGYPHGDELAMIKNGKGDYITIENQIQSGEITQNRGDIEFGHNAPSYNGASGSPALDEYGHLIGVHHAGWSNVGKGSHGFNMAIKAIHLVELNK